MTRANVYEYTRLKSLHDVIGCRRRALLSLWQGFHDRALNETLVVIASLRPEELRLLLAGTPPSDQDRKTVVQRLQFRGSSLNVQQWLKELILDDREFPESDFRNLLSFVTGNETLPAILPE